MKLILHTEIAVTCSTSALVVDNGNVDCVCLRSLASLCVGGLRLNYIAYLGFSKLLIRMDAPDLTLVNTSLV